MFCSFLRPNPILFCSGLKECLSLDYKFLEMLFLQSFDSSKRIKTMLHAFKLLKNKLALPFLIIPLLLTISNAFSKTQILHIRSVEIGDYCWISGYINNKTAQKKFLINVPSEKSLCSTGDSEQETKQWKGKKIKIKTKNIEICEHLPPCGKNDRMFKTPAIVDYELVK